MKINSAVKKHCLAFCLVLMPLFQGCISFSTGPERGFTESATKHQLSVQSVTSVRAKIERMQYSSSHPYYKMKLVADGRFIRHEGHSRKIGTPCMSVGLWPGLSDNEDMGLVIFGSIFFNCVLVGIPTLDTLVFEPFCDYHERTASKLDSADFGLLGFCKYYRGVRENQSNGFETVVTKTLSSFELFGYAVMIEGVRYEDKDYGSGYQGEVYFTSSRPSGSRINIRIVKAPSSRSDGNDGFSGMEGMEISAYLP